MAAGANVAAGTGDVTVKAQSNEADSAKADSDATSGKVGIGASASINVLTGNITKASIEDAATFTCDVAGCGVLSITSDMRHDVSTEDKAGSAGGTLALSPAVSISIASDNTTAHLGTGAALKFTGAATISADEEMTSSLKTDASAGGKNVAIGAAVAINLIEPTTLADVARNLQADSITISSTTQTSSDATSKASANGEKDGDKKGDKQSSDQVQNNDNTKNKTPQDGSGNATPQAGDSTNQANGQTGSKTGDSSSGGVGIAAAIAINWVISNNSALVDGVTLTANNAVKVSAVNLTKSNAFGLGLAIPDSADTSIGAAIGLNVADVHNTADVQANSTITAGSITVEAVAPATKKNEFIIWSVAAAKSKNTVSVAASVGVQVLLFHTKAAVEAGSTLDTAGDMTVHAQAPIGLLNLDVSGGLSTSGAAVGGAIAVNVLSPIDTEAYIDGVSSTTHVDVGGALVVKAEASLDPLTPQLPAGADRLQGLVPMVSSVALGGAAGGGSDPAVSGSVIVDVISDTTNAEIKSGVVVNHTRHAGGGQTVEVTSMDDTHLVNVAGALALSLKGAGVAVSIIVDVIDKADTASIDTGANVWAGGSITVQALSTEKLFELAVGGAGSGSSAAVTGSFIVVVLDTAGGSQTMASIGDATIHSGGQTHVKASDNSDKLELYAGNIAISASSAGVGVAVTVLIRTGTANATVSGSANLDAGSVLVEAIENENLFLVAGAGAGGSSAGVAGSVVVDVLTDNTTATLAGTTNAGGTVAVKATDTTHVLAVAGQIAVGGSAGVGVGVDVEVINKTTNASIAPSANITTTSMGDVVVAAASSENAISIAAGVSLSSSASVAVNATVSVYNITTDATIGSSADVVADGTVGVTADEGLSDSLIAGNVAIGGSAGIGVAAVVPVLTKHTNALIDSSAAVTGKGNGGGLLVNTGSYTVTPTDNRFGGANVSGNVIDTGIDLGFKTGDTVTYDPGCTVNPDDSDSDDGVGPCSIGGLHTNTIYYVIRKSSHTLALADSPDHANSDTEIALTAGNGESHRIIGTQQAQQPADSSPRFTASTAVNDGAHTITLPYAIGVQSEGPVVYSSGGDSPINGLEDGGTYYVIGNTEDGGGNPQAFQLATTKDNAHSHTAIAITAGSLTGRSHSLVKQGNMPSSNVNESAPHTVSAGQTTVFGVAVVATNSDDVNSVAIAVSIGGSAGVGVGGTVNVITVDTNATIASSANVDSVATGVNGDQSVLVAAGNQFHMLLVTASVAIGGGAGVGAGVNVAVLSIHATALIDNNATISAAKDVVVTATQQETLVAVTFAGGGGTVGVAGAVGVIVIGTQAWAKTGTGVTITAGNNVGFLARDDTQITGVTGGVAAGFVGVGVGVYVLVLTKDTHATIASSSSVTANTSTSDALGGISNGTVNGNGFGFGNFRGVVIQAQSSEDIFGMVLALGAGFVGVAVPVGVTLLTVTTQATLAGSVSSGLDVNVSALDKMHTITIAGGVGAGFVGVGAGVDIGVANNSTAAVIANGGSVSTARNVDVNALSWKHVTTYTFAVGGGAVGIGGAVSIWSMGVQPTSSYSDGRGDSGTGQHELGSGAADPSSSADGQVSGGGNGYQSILSGTHTSTSDPVSGKTQGRVDGGTGSPTTTIQNKGNAMGTPAQTALATPINPGTSAQLFGSVTATGHVDVNADDNAAFGGIVGAAGGGAVGIGASILVGSINAETTAEVGGSAVISSGGQVLVHSSLQENTSTLAFAGGGGIVGVGAQVRSSTTAAASRRRSTTALTSTGRSVASTSRPRTTTAASPPSRSAAPSAAWRPASRSASST